MLKTPLSFLPFGLTLGLFLSACQKPGLVTNRPEFSSPNAGFHALLSSIKSGDEQSAETILGVKSSEILSGDPVSDRLDRKRFMEFAAQSVRVRQVTPAVAWVDCGPEAWTFPVPIVKDGKAWEFDGSWGREEIRNRIIGRNELATIGTLRLLAKAQQKYRSMDPDGDGTQTYAERIVSEEGRWNGLYWPSSKGKPKSPLFALAKEAESEGYRNLHTGKVPYHGYYFRMLQEQGKHAPGGKMAFRDAQGQMTQGFAILAWPVSYQRSGMMTFLINKDGMLYEKDLGKLTEWKASHIHSFNPDASWLCYDVASETHQPSMP